MTKISFLFAGGLAGFMLMWTFRHPILRTGDDIFSFG
jgi:hypothetical protein